MSSLRLSVDCDAVPEEIDQNHWIDHLLDSVSVKSILPGRARFHLGFVADETLADTLRRELQKLDTVRLEAYSTRTRNVLVTFDPAVVNQLEVATALLAGVREYARLHGECDMEHHHHERSRAPIVAPGSRDGHEHGADCDHADEHDHAHEEEDCDHDHTATSTDAGIRKELLKVVITGGVLGYFVYKKVRGKPAAFANNPLLDVASLVTIASGYSIFRAGVDSVQKGRKATDDTLISMAVVATLLMGESLTGLSVVWLINLGRLLEAITLKRSRTAIKELMDIAPKEAWLIAGDARGSDPVRVAVEDLARGQRIRIFAGEKVPLDGRVVSGAALAKEAFITGEAIPKEKGKGDSVYAGSLIEHGEVDIEITNLVHDTVVARMIDAIENVRDQKAPIERVGAKFASKFVPISLGIAGATLLVTGDIRRAITMLVIACPCAAGLATPTAVSAGIGQAARKGILIKGGTHIESAAKVDTVIFDKTGTLTLGTPVVQKYVAVDSVDALGFAEALEWAASAEQYTTHPLGVALCKHAREKGIAMRTVAKHAAHAGLGISADVEGRMIEIGNERYMRSLGSEIPEKVRAEIQEGFAAGESVLYFRMDGRVHGAFLVLDTIRPEAAEMLDRLRELGIRRVLLATGDQSLSAQHVAQRLGIAEVHAELLPQDKLALVRQLRESGCKVAMVGDGINDAQALAEADLSIAMGGGHCDVAIEAADVTLARNDLRLVAETLHISQQTLKTIYQNFVASVGINAGGLALSARGNLSPFSAALVHNASTIAVVLNSLRLGRKVAGENPLKTLKEVRI